MRNSIKVSVIVPVYNVEKYLERCLDSLVHQTLDDIEVIVINDGSTDGSQYIIDEFEQKYSQKIKSKTIENGGVANARNVALDLAQGEFVGFVDSDDYVELSMFEDLYNEAKESQGDISVCGYYTETNHFVVSRQLGQLEEYNQSLLENPNILVAGTPYLWNKIFKREIIEKNHLRFEKFKIFEDLLFTYQVFLKSGKIVKVDKSLYYYIKEREGSATAQFSIKFADVFPVMKRLKEYYKMDKNYPVFAEYITYTAIHHIYLRFPTKIDVPAIKLKYKYITLAFTFLDKEFPDWRENFYFKKFRYKKSKGAIYWTYKSLMQRIEKNRKKIKKARKIKVGDRFQRLYDSLDIDEHSVFIQSQQGKDINGNMFYLIKEMLTNEEYKDYKIYIGVVREKIEEFETKLDFYNLYDYTLVVIDSDEFLTALASSKYLFTDTSLPLYFIKKEEQVYLNTWHGTPLKTLGRKVANDYYNIANLQKNFMVADYLLYPSEFMMNRMIEDYMLQIKNKILLCGYPRNTIFFDKARATELKEEKKQTIAYMPTWRGTLLNVNNTNYLDLLNGFLDEIEEGLNDNQVFYLNVHPYLKDQIQIRDYKKIKMFPKEYETYDFLNSCDVLVTDYSSVFFDYALTRKKIILFTYDEEEYLADRGLYFPLSELPFPDVKDIKGLLKEINDLTIPNYDEFIETYAKYDHKDVARDLCSLTLQNKQPENLKILEPKENKKKNVLIQSNDFLNVRINQRLLKIFDKGKYENYNIYLGFINSKLRKNKKYLLDIPKDVYYMGQLRSFSNLSPFEKGLKFLLIRYPQVHVLFTRRFKKMFMDELKRTYPTMDFDYTLIFDEKSVLRIYLYSYMKNYKIIYLSHYGNPKKFHKVYDKYDRIIVADETLKEKLSPFISEDKIFVRQVSTVEDLLQ